MTALLQQTYDKLLTLPPEQQDHIAKHIEEYMADFLDDMKWEKSFAESGEQLEKLANEALEEDRQGKTVPLENILK